MVEVDEQEQSRRRFQTILAGIVFGILALFSHAIGWQWGDCATFEFSASVFASWSGCVNALTDDGRSASICIACLILVWVLCYEIYSTSCPPLLTPPVKVVFVGVGHFLNPLFIEKVTPFCGQLKCLFRGLPWKPPDSSERIPVPGLAPTQDPEARLRTPPLSPTHATQVAVAVTQNPPVN